MVSTIVSGVAPSLVIWMTSLTVTGGLAPRVAHPLNRVIAFRNISARPRRHDNLFEGLQFFRHFCSRSTLTPWRKAAVLRVVWLHALRLGGVPPPCQGGVGGVSVGTVGLRDAMVAGFFDRKWKRDRHFPERQDIPEPIIAGLGSRSEAAFEAVAQESTHGASPQPLARVRPRCGRESVLRLVVFFFQPATDVQPQLPESAAQGFPADRARRSAAGSPGRSLEVACAHVGPSIAVIPPATTSASSCSLRSAVRIALRAAT